MATSGSKSNSQLLPFKFSSTVTIRNSPKLNRSTTRLSLCYLNLKQQFTALGKHFALGWPYSTLNRDGEGKKSTRFDPN